MYHRDSLLSKSLSWLLRHGACQEGFELSPEGYLEVEKILQHPIYKDKCHLSDIETIVANDPKQRFKLQYNPTFGYLEIKAHQGHSIRTVTEGLTPITTPKYETVVHGTHFKYWPSIRRDGLNRMTRNHIHFAKRTSQANYISGLRGNAEVLIYVDLKKALDEGLKFYESDNGVILTSGNEQGFLEPQYFLKVLCAKTGSPEAVKICRYATGKTY